MFDLVTSVGFDALEDSMASQFLQSLVLVSNRLNEFSGRDDSNFRGQGRESESSAVASSSGRANLATTTSMVYLPQTVVLCELRHESFEACVPSGPSDSGLVLKYQPKDRMKTGCVALVLCLNISVDPPDVIKISPCARMECWIGSSSTCKIHWLESLSC